MKCTLIGASGFIGTRLASITKTDFKLRIIDKQQSKFHPEITILADVRNQEELRRELKGQDSVVLLAAEHRDDVMPTSLYYDVNVQGTKNV
jgi:nucleoside-diphosphate-sugar epimerase